VLLDATQIADVRAVNAVSIPGIAVSSASNALASRWRTFSGKSTGNCDPDRDSKSKPALWEAVIDSVWDLGYDAHIASVRRRRTALRPCGAKLHWNGDMPFVDTSKLEVIEKGIGGWRGRQFHSPSMTFCHGSSTTALPFMSMPMPKKKFG
jgi:hypothetical protein